MNTPYLKVLLRCLREHANRTEIGERDQRRERLTTGVAVRQRRSRDEESPTRGPLSPAIVARSFMAAAFLSLVAYGVVNADRVSDAAGEWPDGIERRLTWILDEADVTGLFYVRIPNAERLTAILPDYAGLFDDLGRFVESEYFETDDRLELWFQAQPGRGYFSGWIPDQPLPQAERHVRDQRIEQFGLTADGDDGLLDALIGDVLGRPERFHENLPVVQARPGRLLRRSRWVIDDGAAFQHSRDRNVFLVSRPAYDDLEMHVEVYPGSASYVGLAVAVEDPALPDRTGIYWLIGSAREADQTGYHRTFGVVTTDEPGPQLVRADWNRLSATVVDRVVTLSLNGKITRTLTLPDEWSGPGHIALATFGGTARFRNPRVVDPHAAQTVLFEDRFTGDRFDSERWIDANDRIEQGFVRVFNDHDTAQNYRFTHLKHRDPFYTRNQRFDERATDPGQVTPWLLMNDWYRGAPYSVIFGAGYHGTVEFAAHPRDDAILRRIALPGDHALTFEITRANFHHADQIQTSLEIGAALLADVKAMTFIGSRPEVFPVGWPDGNRLMWEAGRLMGFNQVKIGPSARHVEPFEDLGFTYINTFSHWLGQFRRGGGGYRRENNARTAAEFHRRWQETGMADRVVQIDVFDEAVVNPGGVLRREALPDLSKDPYAWEQIIRAAGLTPEAFIRADDPPPPDADPMSETYWRHVRFYHADDRESNPEGVYNSLKAHDGIWRARFGNFRSDLRRHFGDRLKVTANLMYPAFFSDRMAGLDPFVLYSVDPVLDMPQVCDYRVGWPQQKEWLMDLMRCAQRPNPPGAQAYLASQVSFASRSRRSLQLRAFAALGAGVRSVNFYRWGPRYSNTENWYDTDRSRLQTIGDIAHAIGFVDRILAEGTPRQSRIAILHSVHDTRWNCLERYRHAQGERRVLFHLLRGLHRQPDFIADEIPPPAQGLEWDDYRVIFICQRTMTEATAEALLDWVRRGGHLIALGHCGEWDALGRPWDRMTAAFGLRSIRPLESEEHRTIDGSTVVTHPTGAMVVEATDVDTVAARFSDGSPAKIVRPLGDGRLVYLPFHLGRSYHHGGASRARMQHDVLLGMQMDVLDWTAPLLEPAGLPIAETDDPLIGARLIESEHGSAVILLNTTGKPTVENVEVRIRHDADATVESLHQGSLNAHRSSDGRLTFSLPMGLTDIVRVLPR